MRKSTKILFGTLAVFCLVILGGVGLLVWETDRFLNTPASIVLHQEARFYYITVEPGSTFDRVAEQIAEEGGVSNAFKFKMYARWQGAGNRIKAGDYEFRTDWTPRQVMQQLIDGKALLHRVTIPEGLPWWQVAALLEEQGFARAEDFSACVSDSAQLRRYGIPLDNAEGFLFPDTYLFSKPRTLTKQHAATIMHAMVQNFWKRTAPVWEEAAQAEALTPVAPSKGGQSASAAADAVAASILAEAGVQPVAGTQQEAGTQESAAPEPGDQAPSAQQNTGGVQTPDIGAASGAAAGQDAAQAAQSVTVIITSPRNIIASFVPQFAKDHPDEVKKILIMASLVEKESGVPDERPRIAGVFQNRLKANMPLQCDPTVIYGLGKTFSGQLSRQHLADPKNLYNTYRIFGLPPGPICSPGLDAIQAALKPESHGYYYFVATGKSDGRHIFSKNLREHNNAVQQYRKALQATD